MKKIILVMMVIACHLSQVDAQLHFGIKAGLSFNSFNLKKTEWNLDNATGWQAGALLQFKVPVIGLGVQPELLYTVKKADVDGQSNSIHYFEVPLNLRWGFNLAIIRPYILAGPYFSYAVHLNGKVFESDIDRFDWGIGLGAGVEFWKLQLGGRYSWGLQNVSSGKDFEMKNNMFTLSLAFLF